MKPPHGTERVLVTGGPSSGKTTLSDKWETEDMPVRHADDLIETHTWSEASAKVAEWLDAPGPWIIEGVSVPRALRKWLTAHPEGKPADRLLWLPEVYQTPTREQRSMTEGGKTVLRQIHEDLRERGVTIEGWET